MFSDEITYYQDNAVHITNERAKFGEITYPMKLIQSVSVHEQKIRPATQIIGWLVVALGVVIIIIAVILEITASAQDFTGVTTAGFVVILLGIFLAFFVRPRPSYVLRIRSEWGEVDALVSRDKAYLQKIIGIMNEAII